MTTERTWSLLAVPAAVGDLRSAVCAFAAAEGVEDPPLADIRLAVSEAVTNAVIHGYRHGNAPGDVVLAATVFSDRVDVVVSDQGAGFAARDDSPGGGMGMALMVAVTDGFFVREGDPRGTEVHMAFERRWHQPRF